MNVDQVTRHHMGRHRKTSFQAVYDALGYSPGGKVKNGVLYIRLSFIPEIVKEVRLVSDDEYDGID